MKKPMLEGVRVIDLTSVVFGPYATQILADLGADVIKVEAPGGDQFRYSGKPAKSAGMAPGFMALNRNKRSIVLDLNSDGDRDVMTGLIKSADIFIHNVRLNAIQKLGFGPEQVKAIRDDLIYIHCVGFGSSGPYEGLQAYDDVIQAASGAATLAGRVDGTGDPRYIPSLIADKVAGLHGAQAALVAFVHKMRTGEGQFVEVPMFETFSHFLLTEHLGGLTFDPPNADVCYYRQIDPHRQPFPTADGHVSIVPYTLDSWRVVFDVAEDAGFLEQPGLRTSKDWLANQSRLYQRLKELTPGRTTKEWVERFRAARIPCMPVRDMADVREDPHLMETGFFQHRSHPTEGLWCDMSSPIHYSAYAGERHLPPPMMGQHSDEIREEIDLIRVTPTANTMLERATDDEV